MLCQKVTGCKEKSWEVQNEKAVKEPVQQRQSRAVIGLDFFNSEL